MNLFFRANRMYAKDVFNFAYSNLICYPATMDGDQLHLLLFFDIGTEFSFSTVSSKNISRQLLYHPKTDAGFL
jgi:hypothetical protein